MRLIGIAITITLGMIGIIHELGEYCSEINPYRFNVETEEENGEEKIL